MLRFLFPRLTTHAAPGPALFGWITAQARAEHWYRSGEIEDSVDGRFAMLATITALVTVRLELAGNDGAQAAVTLTEHFIEVMESEHREMGLGDPALGRTVRKLVASLGRRVELWRSAGSDGEWIESARRCVYRKAEPSAAALAHTSDALRALWSHLESASDAALVEGRLE